MPNHQTMPLVAVTADRALNGAHQSHSAGEKYLTAVSTGAGCLPMILPALNDDRAIANYLERVDGVTAILSPTIMVSSRLPVTTVETQIEIKLTSP